MVDDGLSRDQMEHARCYVSKEGTVSEGVERGFMHAWKMYLLEDDDGDRANNMKRGRKDFYL